MTAIKQINVHRVTTEPITADDYPEAEGHGFSTLKFAGVTLFFKDAAERHSWLNRALNVAMFQSRDCA